MSKAMVDVQWAFISIFTASLTHFVLRIVLGRELGPEGLGIYTLAFTVYLFGMQFAAFGIGPALTKYVAEFIDDQTKIRNYISSGLTSSIVTGAIMGIVLFILAPYIAINFFRVPELEDLIQLTAICFPFIAVQKAVLGTLNGFRKMHLYALLTITQNVAIVGISLVLVIVFGLGVQGAIVGLTGSTILVSILCPFLIREHIGLDNSLWNIPALRATTIFGFYIVLDNSISFINTQINSIFIGYYLNPAEVGIFAVSALLVQTLTLIPSAVQRVTNPVMANMHGKGDLEGLRNIYYSTLKKSFIITAGCAAIIAVLGPFLITLLFRDEFQASYIPLLILLPGFIIGASFSAVGATLSSIGKVRIPFRINGVCVVLNIILNVSLIPFLGISGAAIATSVTMISNCWMNLVIIRKYLYQK